MILHALGIAATAGASWFARECLSQLRGPKNGDGKRGPCLRDLVAALSNAMDRQAIESAARHSMVLGSFLEINSRVSELERRLISVESRLSKTLPRR